MENMNNNMNDNLNNINDNNDQDNKKDKKKMSFKKGAGIALCAVLAGGLAFEGVSAVNGWDFSNIVQASDKDENKTTLLKTKTIRIRKRLRKKQRIPKIRMKRQKRILNRK